MSTAEQLWMPPVTFKKILFATDLCPSSTLAFPFAESIAKHYGAKVFIAHVIPASEAITPNSIYAETKKVLATLPTLGSLRHELLLEHGSVSNKLLEEIEKFAIDLIVLGTQGWHGFSTLVKGSTAKAISTLASPPVLTVGPQVSRSSEFKRILYATDFSPEAAHAMPYVLSLSYAFNAYLFFLHVNEWSSTEPPIEAEPRTVEFVRKQLHDAGISMSMEGRYEILVDFGRQADVILEAATSHNVDLIIMGTHAHPSLMPQIAAHLPSSVSYEVASTSRCPVLTVPFEAKKT